MLSQRAVVSVVRDHLILPKIGGARRGVKHAVCLFQHDGAVADVLIRLMMRKRARVSISPPKGGAWRGGKYAAGLLLNDETLADVLTRYLRSSGNDLIPGPLCASGG